MPLLNFLIEYLLDINSFKIIYMAWFILDTIRLYHVNHKFIRATGFITLAFGTFTLWRLYGLPASIHIFF